MDWALNRGISFRPAVEEDLAFLLELRRQTMNAHLVAG